MMTLFNYWAASGAIFSTTKSTSSHHLLWSDLWLWGSEIGKWEFAEPIFSLLWSRPETAGGKETGAAKVSKNLFSLGFLLKSTPPSSLTGWHGWPTHWDVEAIADLISDVFKNAFLKPRGKAELAADSVALRIKWLNCFGNVYNSCVWLTYISVHIHVCPWYSTACLFLFSGHSN